MYPLQSWGFGPAFLAQLDPSDFDSSGAPRAARVAHLSHGLLTLAPDGRVAALTGALRDGEDRPVVGDWVLLDPQGRVGRILTRQSLLRRRDPSGGVQALAANVDTVFITTSLNQDLNPRRIERFVTLVRASGAEPVIVLTKADLVPDPAAGVDAVREAAAGADVVCTSGALGDVDALAPWCGAGRTVVFIGASGVGKSTLVNAWIGRDVATTSHIRAHDDRGRHTTTDRRIHQAPDGTLLVDLPGVREVGLVGDEDPGEAAFPDVVELARDCRFRDCSHTPESAGCALQAALTSGDLDPARWAAWRKLERERTWAAVQVDPAAARAQREVWKRRHADVTAREKWKGRQGW